MNAQNLEKIDNTLPNSKKIYYSALDRTFHENLFRPLNEGLIARQKSSLLNRYNTNHVFLKGNSKYKVNTSEFYEVLDELDVTLNNLKEYLLQKEKLFKDQRKEEILENERNAQKISEQNAINEQQAQSMPAQNQSVGINNSNSIDNDFLMNIGSDFTDNFSNKMESTNDHGINDFNIGGNTNTSYNNNQNNASYSTNPVATNQNNNTSQPLSKNNGNNAMDSLNDFGIDLSMFELDNNLGNSSANTNQNIEKKPTSVNSNNEGMPDLNLNDFNLDNLDLNLDLGPSLENNGNFSANTNDQNAEGNTGNNGSNPNTNFEFNFDWE